MVSNKSICKDNNITKETSTVRHKTICSFTPHLVKLFLSKVKKEKNGCWLWNGGKNDHGYGEFCVNGFNFYAHRVAYSWFIKPIDEGKLVCHLCDVKSCCNPHHLFEGTQKENMKDAIKKGIMHKGERSGQAKLTDEEVILIRKKYKKNMYGYKKLGKEFGVRWENIVQIVKGKTWKHLNAH